MIRRQPIVNSAISVLVNSFGDGPFCVCIAMYLVLAMPAHAQSSNEGAELNHIRGAFSLGSLVGIEALNDTNIFRSETNVLSSQLWKLKPSVLMRFEPARSRLELSYNGDYGWYDRFNNDDYTDHALEAGAYLMLGELSGLDLIVSYEDEHEDRGTGLTQGFDPMSGTFPEDPDRYNLEQALARYTYGITRTRAFISLEGSAKSLTYKNNRARTQQFDREESYGQGTLGLRIRSTTSLQVRVRAKDVTYDHPRTSGFSPDSQENRYLFGVEWETTAKTTGTVLVGRVEKKFDDPTRPDFSGPNWEVGIRWSPRTYSHFDLRTERYPEEPVDILADVTDTRIYSLGWTHKWNDRLESELAISRVDRKYRLVTGVRNDKSPKYSFALTYTMRPWLHWQAGVDLNARNSDVATHDYDQTIARVGAWFTF